MGRELKRVPLDFKWAIDQVWKGYVNPYRGMPCKACDQSGLNPATRKLSDDWYAFDNPKYIYIDANRRYNDNAWQYHLTQVEVDALVEADRLGDFTSEFIPGEGWKKKDPPYIPTAAEVNAWAIHNPMGHDGVNQWICVEARAKSLGVYGHCEYCNGTGTIWQSDEIEALSKNWQSFDPPTGEGYQLWGTTNEGAPMTPVFETLEALCEYCERESVSVFGKSTATKEQWMEMLSSDLGVVHREGNAIFI